MGLIRKTLARLPKIKIIEPPRQKEHQGTSQSGYLIKLFYVLLSVPISGIVFW
jgi:hypothetical protein